MYTLSDLAQVYGRTVALTKISCTIPIDGLTVIMGPSGSGKSTLLRLLSFIERPTHGVVSLDLTGRHFGSDSATRPWPAVTCVFQRLFLWPHLTVRDNILIPAKNVDPVRCTERVSRIAQLFGIADLMSRYPNEISGGQAQRVALARAFVLSPTVILIDEAHTGLDLAQQHILNEHFTSLRHSGVGLIIATHSLAFAREYADFVVVIEDGILSEAGTRDVLDHPQSTYLRDATRIVGSAPERVQ